METFSKRQRRIASAGQPMMYQFDEIPGTLRVQVIHIWGSAIGPYVNPTYHDAYKTSLSTIMWRNIFSQLTRELGVFSLGSSDANPFYQCQQFIQSASTSDVLDIVELSFQVINTTCRKLTPSQRSDSQITQSPDSAIDELNVRFREHGVGYQFTNGQIVRVDSEYLHMEVMEPTIRLLHDDRFNGPLAEFMTAHEHYRKQEYSQAIVEANKAFESTMKVICDRRRWQYPPTSPAKKLLEILFDQGLIPLELQSHFTALRSTLESGAPTIRNKPGRGHGAGSQPLPIPGYLAAYTLHLVAANIVLLIEAMKASK